jgi:hypothetical protein
MLRLFNRWGTNDTCPQCHHHHGHRVWAVMNSAVTHPLRCRHCHQFFHQTGLGWWVLFLLVVPNGSLFIFHWLPGMLLTFLSVLLAAIFIRLRCPLVCGPRSG